MSAIVSGLVGALVAGALMVLAERQPQPARGHPDGWRRLSGGWLLNATIICCLAMVALPVFMLLNGGSARPDSATQNMYAVGLAFAFSVMAAAVWWVAHGRRIRWKGDDLVVRDMFGREKNYRFSDLMAFDKREGWGDYRCRFRDQQCLKFSIYLAGARELAEVAGAALRLPRD